MAPNDLSSPSAVDHVSFSFDDDSHSHLSSSPPRPLAGGGKERRQPSITPRKFRRFFTPRSRVPAHPSAARAALRDLTARALNGVASSSPPPPLGYGQSPTHTLDGSGGHENGFHHGLPSPRSAKRRRTNHFTPDTSPLKPYSLAVSAGVIHRGGRAARTPEAEEKASRVPAMPLSPSASSPPQPPALDDFSDGDDLAMSDAGSGPEPEMELDLESPTFSRFTSLAEYGGLTGQLLQRQLGTMSGPGNHTLDRPVADWRADTADFYSSYSDIHLCSSHENENERCIPFCAAACNTNGLVAVGDEEGRIRLLDADGPGRDDFNKAYLSFPAHGNAIIDLAFSGDDRLLATASGDQTGKVFDMMSQTPISILDHHTASLKQVRFQPGRSDGNVLATSGRDGCIKIWDLRCKGGPAQEFTAIEWTTGLQYGPPRKVNQGCVVNSIYDAHARVPVRPTRQTRQQQVAQQAAAAAAAAAAVVSTNTVHRWDVPGRAGEVSVTAIQFLPPGREHLLFSACEADASVKVWDIRNVNPTSRTGRGASSSATPVAITAPPESHSQWRPFGLSSLSLSTDGARLYGLCKDNTVYAYSTAHLVIGSAPEPWSKEGQLQQLQQNHQQQPPPPPRRRHAAVHEGPGPLFGLRHENFHATSFYVKTAVRPAQNGQSELLAVGSSDGCAVLFPTDEQCILDAIRNEDTAAAAAATTMMPSRRAGGGALQGPRAGLFRTNSMSSNINTGGRLVDTIPVARSGFGTALVRGHEKKEVGAVCWTHAGRLVTVGDDFMVRRWHEDRVAAATLRTGGEAGGQRWMSGWADVGEDWDAVDAAEEEAFF